MSSTSGGLAASSARRTAAIGIVMMACAVSGQAAAWVDPVAPATREAALADDRVASARDRVLPFVVSILTVREDYAQGNGRLNVSGGSGTVVTAAGHVVTNAHVTQNGRAFRVIFADQRERAARLVGEDSLSDVAVLQVDPVDGEQFAHARFSSTLTLRSGDTVMAMGAPWGYSQSLSMGVVNNTSRLLASFFQDEADYEASLGPDEPTGRYYAWIQHDAAISPGNSGGPLVDLDGNVVGVNTRGSVLGGDMAFAIPAPEAMAIANQLIANGTVTRSTLGFKLRSLHGTGHDRGALVYAVQRDSPAARAGLTTGDRILAVNGRDLDVRLPEQVPAAQRLLAELPSGKPAKLRVQDGGKARILDVVPEPYPSDRGDEFELRPFGLTLVALTPAMAARRGLDDAQGLLVTGVRPGGAASTLRPAPVAGDVLRRVAGNRVHARAHLDPWLVPVEGKVEPVLVEIEHRGEQRVALLVPQHGDVTRSPLPDLPKPWSGVEVQAVTPVLARALGVGEGHGYRITRVYPTSPLAAAGAQVGDVLVSIAERPLKPANETDVQSFHERVADIDEAGPVRFRAVRTGRVLELDATLRSAPLPAAAQRSSEIAQLDAVVRDLAFYDRVALRLPEDARGVIVEQVQTGSPAGLAHLQVGDAIVSLDGEPIDDVMSFRIAFRKAQETDTPAIAFEVRRGAESRLLYLDKSWLSEAR